MSGFRICLLIHLINRPWLPPHPPPPHPPTPHSPQPPTPHPPFLYIFLFIYFVRKFQHILLLGHPQIAFTIIYYNLVTTFVQAFNPPPPPPHTHTPSYNICTGFSIPPPPPPPPHTHTHTLPYLLCFRGFHIGQFPCLNYFYAEWLLSW